MQKALTLQASPKLQGAVEANAAISPSCPSSDEHSEHIFCTAGSFVIDRRTLLREASVYSLTFLKRNLENFPDSASAPTLTPPCRRPARETASMTKFINAGRATLSFTATTVGDPIKNLWAG